MIKQNIQPRKSIALTYSALKTSYRNILGVSEHVRFIYLRGAYKQIETRLQKRKGHFTPANMLSGQFDILEGPQDTLTIDITRTPQEIIALIRKGLDL